MTKVQLYAIFLFFACIGTSVLAFNQFKRKTHIGGTMVALLGAFLWWFFLTKGHNAWNGQIYPSPLNLMLGAEHKGIKNDKTPPKQDFSGKA